MRIRSFCLMTLLALSGSPAAMAFNCSGISLPSSIVICSDPDLIRLADERQQIYNDTRSRLTPDQQNALWEDQKAWVRSYATACGVPPDSPPPIPAPPNVTECFKRSAEARAAFLRTYGLSGDASSAPAHQAALAPTEAKSNDVDEIALVQAGRLFEIPVRVNGAITLNFIIDSGASDVQIPFDVFSTLVRANTIQKGDLTGEQTYVLADGSKQKSFRFLIRELRIGNHVLHDVPGSVGSPTGSLLLGQSFLAHFDSWTLDNKRHVLKLVGKTEASSETASDQQPTPMASLAVPALPRNEHTVALCGQPVEYQSSNRADVGDDTVGIGYVGVWAGHWNNAARLCGGLIVEGVDPGGEAKVIYVYGPSRPGTGLSWKQQHRVGVVRNFVLSFEDDQGSIFRFRLSGGDALDASFVGRAGHLAGNFERIR